jgi:hypothetical protein
MPAASSSRALPSAGCMLHLLLLLSLLLLHLELLLLLLLLMSSSYSIRLILSHVVQLQLPIFNLDFQSVYSVFEPERSFFLFQQHTFTILDFLSQLRELLLPLDSRFHQLFLNLFFPLL